MYNPVLFKDRIEAGQKLGWQLKKLNLKNPLILAIPSGGIPVGIEVAKILKCPFDLVIVRKIQFPWTTEAGFGAIAADGTLYLGSAARELPQEVIKTQTKKAAEEAKHREKEFLKEFNKFTKKLFSFRRKTILNTLSKTLDSKEEALRLLDILKIDHTLRVEMLSIDTLIELFRLTTTFKR